MAPLLVSRSMHPAEFSFGGPAGGRTRVRNAFALKGLQQFLKSCHSTTFQFLDQHRLDHSLIKPTDLL